MVDEVYGSADGRCGKAVNNMSLGLLVLTALFLGMRHALDPDHLAAVSTLVAEERRVGPAARLGLVWGVGHLVPIVALGLPIIVFELQLPAALEALVDLGVGVLLVALGITTAWRLWRHGVHGHGHAHAGHPHPSPRTGLMALLVGMVHGLAGSGAAVLVAAATAPSVPSRIAYLLMFGVGTCAGMFLMTLCVAAPALAGISRFARLQAVVRGGISLASALVGVLLWVENLPIVLGG